MALIYNVPYGFLETNMANDQFKFFLGVPLSTPKEVSFVNPILHTDQSGVVWYGIKVEISRNPPITPEPIKYNAYILNAISAGKPVEGVLVQCEDLNTNQIRFLLMKFAGCQQVSQFTSGYTAFNCPYTYIDSNNSKPEKDQLKVFVPTQGYQLIAGSDKQIPGNDFEMQLQVSQGASSVIDSNTINSHPGFPIVPNTSTEYTVFVHHFDNQQQQQQGSPRKSKSGGKVARVRAGGIGRPLPSWVQILRSIRIRSTITRWFKKHK